MKLAPKTQKQLEIFFREYFGDRNLKLPEIQIYVKKWAGLITKIIGVHGITIGRHIFIAPRLVQFDTNKKLRINKNLMAHEVAHVVQYQKLGFFGFLLNYLQDYFSILRSKKRWHSLARMEAYWEIPLEIEARDAAQKFERWIKDKKIILDLKS